MIIFHNWPFIWNKAKTTSVDHCDNRSIQKMDGFFFSVIFVMFVVLWFLCKKFSLFVNYAQKQRLTADQRMCAWTGAETISHLVE